MSDDLERYEPDINGCISYEHMHRYALCVDYVKGKTILDVASGEGYGSHMLAQKAEKVFAIDIDKNVIDRASKKYYKDQNLNFIAANCLRLPLQDSSLDVVISFETIEHIADHQLFLSEVCRVLKKGGVFIVSTPNRPVYSEDPEFKNPFHVKEFDKIELDQLLKSTFRHVCYLGQRFIISSIISDIESNYNNKRSKLLIRKSEKQDIKKGLPSFNHQKYFIAICSNEKTTSKMDIPSLYTDEKDDLWREHERIFRWASALDKEFSNLNKNYIMNQKLLEDKTKFIESISYEYKNLIALLKEKEIFEKEIKNNNNVLEGEKTNYISEISLLKEQLSEAESQGIEYQKYLDNLKLDYSLLAFKSREQEIELKNYMQQVDICHSDKNDLIKKNNELEAAISEYKCIDERHKYEDAQQNIEISEYQKKCRIVNLRQSIKESISSASKTVQNKLSQKPSGLVVRDRKLKLVISQNIPYKPLGRLERRDIETSGFFDPAWYLDTNLDVKQSGVDPTAHYFNHGYKEDRDPHPYFSSAWYRSMYFGEIGEIPPILHYIRTGSYKFYQPSPLFDPNYYVKTNSDLNLPSQELLEHYIRFGEEELRNPHPLINSQLLKKHTELVDVPRHVLAYITKQEFYHLNPHNLFDASFYNTEYSELVRLGICPLLHYSTLGWREGRQPNALFCGDWYLVKNPDVLAAQINPLVHYVIHGWKEDRLPHPLLDPNCYSKNNNYSKSLSIDPLTHYRNIGKNLKNETTDIITIKEMRSIVSEKYWQMIDPITAFINYGDGYVSIPPSLLKKISKVTIENTEILGSANAKKTYFMPQKLREYITNQYSHDDVEFYASLMAIIEEYGDRPTYFKISQDYIDLLSFVEKKKLAGFNKNEPTKIDVTIVIPVYNNIMFTLASIATIFYNKSNYSYEVIVADDNSTDTTAEVFSKIGGSITYLKNTSNIGFLKNCNKAASLAKGKYVIFLNNDTLVLPGWLNELIDVFNRDKTVGLAGSKLLNSNGTLQEAGGIVWNDGSAWNYGRNYDPNLPEFNYLKEVDYISGASIALPASLWRKLQGFDEYYTPAYCEDSDLAFRVREQNLKVVYSPHSAVIHHEGKSHGMDIEEGIKRYQQINQQKFKDRWLPVLSARHSKNGEDVFTARDRSSKSPHILIIDHYVPQWDRDAGSRTMYHFIRLFIASGFHVTFWPDNLNYDETYCRHLQNLGIEIIYSNYYESKFPDFIQENGKYYHYALLSRPHIALKYYEHIRAHTDCLVMYYGHDLHFKRMENEHELLHNHTVFEINEMRNCELENWKNSDVIFYPSSVEVEIIKSILPQSNVADVPMLGYLHEELAQASNNTSLFNNRNFDELLFVGGSHPPNLDALQWFTSEIMPRVLEFRPATRLIVVGKGARSLVKESLQKQIIFKDWVGDDELLNLYATVGVVVAPLRFGAGVKGKTIEALINSVPLVATNIAMQGLFPAEPIAYIADTAEEFAKAVVSAQSNQHKSKLQSENGFHFIQNNYSIESLRNAFKPFVSHLKNAYLQ